MTEQFSTFKEDLENIGIRLTDEQYSDLCEINLFMNGMPDIPAYNILLVLKTLGLIPTKAPDQENGFENKFGKIKKI